MFDEMILAIHEDSSVEVSFGKALGRVMNRTCECDDELSAQAARRLSLIKM